MCIYTMGKSNTGKGKILPLWYHSIKILFFLFTLPLLISFLFFLLSCCISLLTMTSGESSATPVNISNTPTFHPAFSVSNIKNHIQITLEMENVHYASWAELFTNAAVSFEVADHITPPKDSVITKDAQWLRLDAIVKQWIYNTISLDLLHTILKPGATAQEAWERLKDIFNDNKSSRVVYLEQQFSQIHMDNFPNASSYCQSLKMLADQLDNVGAPVSEDRLVLRLVTGLSSGYESLATIIQQLDPLHHLLQGQVYAHS